MTLLFTSAPAAAQFKWGIKAGVNVSEKPSNFEEVESIVKGKAGWYVGPMAKVTIPAVGLGIEANLLYSQTSTEIGGENIKRQTLDLPIYLRYEISIPPANEFIEPFIAVGPQWSWNIGESNYIIDIVNATGGSYPIDYTLRNSNLSLNLGLGAVILRHFQIHANYGLALGSTSNYCDEWNAAINAYEKIVKSRTNTWQISIGYLF